jgi:hypothetical protein
MPRKPKALDTPIIFSTKKKEKKRLRYDNGTIMVSYTDNGKCKIIQFYKIIEHTKTRQQTPIVVKLTSKDLVFRSSSNGRKIQNVPINVPLTGTEQRLVWNSSSDCYSLANSLKEDITFSFEVYDPKKEYFSEWFD